MLNSFQEFVASRELPKRNYLLNGDMQIVQRTFLDNKLSLSGAVTRGFFIDRWWVSRWSSTFPTVEYSYDNVDVPNRKYSRSLTVKNLTSKTSLATDEYCHIVRNEEAIELAPLIGKTYTISFWVKSSVRGKYSLSIAYRANESTEPSKTYMASYQIARANTWERKSITITGGLPESYDWVNTEQNSLKLRISFTLCSGTTYQTNTQGSWIDGNFLAVQNQVNFVATANSVFKLAGVQMELGDTATEMEPEPYAVALAKCQRFYQEIGDKSVVASFRLFGYTTASGAVIQTHQFKVSMRKSPTIVLPSLITANITAAGVITSKVTKDSFQVHALATAQGVLDAASDGVTAGYASCE